MSDKQTVILVPVKPRTTDLSIKNDRVIFVPLATKDSFGVVKVGDGLLIDDGLLSFDYTDFEQAYLDKKLDKFQGIDNSGKILCVGSDGNISLRDSEYKGISVKEDDSLISSDTLTLNFKDSFDVTSNGTETSVSLKDIYVKKFNYSEFKEIEALGADTWSLLDKNKEILIGDFDFTGSSLRKNNTIMINKIGIVATSSDPNSNAYSMINCRSNRVMLGYVSDTGNFSGISIASDGSFIDGNKILTESYVSDDDLIYLNQDKLDFNTVKLIEDLNNYNSYTLANNNIYLQHSGSDSGNGSTQFLLRRNDSELYLVSSEDSSGSKLGLYFNGFDVGVEYMNGNVNLLTDTVYWNGQPLALDGLNNVDTDMIVDGAITTSKISDGAVTDSKIDSVSGTKVSGVVRTTQQTLTDAEKQQAQTNMTHTATQDHATSGVQVGWYQVANLKTNGNYDIKIKQGYNYNFPEAIHLSISINNRLFTGQPFASITQLSGVKPAAFALSKIRVRQGTDAYTTYLDVYNPDQLWNTTWVDITSDSQDVVVEPNTPFQFIGTEDNPSGYKISSLDLVTGFNTNTPLKSDGNVIVDTRSVNSPPSYYADQQTCYEFKSTSVLGLTELMPSEPYVTLKSVKGWIGDNYTVYQEAVCAGNDLNALNSGLVCYRYGVEDTWGEWKTVGTFLPYEYNKQKSFGESGYLYIGKFPIYDTNITVDISSTTSTTYSGKLVIACQNYAVLKASVFGDYSNMVTPNIYYRKVDNTVEIYFKPTAWSKNVIHITGCGIRGEVTHVCENISTIPSDATLQPENEYVESGQTGAGQTELIYDMDSTDASINHGFTSGMKGGDYIDQDYSQYRKVRIYARLYNANCVQEIAVKNRKYADITLNAASPTPTVFSFLKLQMSLEPYLNRLQVMAYARYAFSTSSGTFTLDYGLTSDSFYVYRIEGIK